MNGTERIAHLEAKNSALRAEVKALRKQLARVLARQPERKRPLQKDSHISSKLPSTDGLTRKTRSLRIKSGRKVGGQRGHPGSTLPLVEQADEIFQHRPQRCVGCQHPLAGIAGEIIERRQVQDLPPASSELAGITAGPDCALWFTTANSTNGVIGRITTAGVITLFPLPTAFGIPMQITSGPNGNLWFTGISLDLTTEKIGRITPAGAFTGFDVPGPQGLTGGISTGPDGNLWFTDNKGRIGRITPTGTITEFSLPPASNVPAGITVGPDGNLWFVEGPSGTIGRITSGL